MFKKTLRIFGKSLITLAVLLVIIASLAGVKALQIRALIAAGKNMTMSAETVSTQLVEKQQWNPVISGVGNVVAVQGVTVTTEIPGKVVRIHFESGTDVNEGDILLEFDASTERAQLNSAFANAELAKINVIRARELFQKEAIAKSELDTVEARATEAEAQVENLEAVLAKKLIRAPFAGRLGIRQVNLGQFVGSGQPVVSLQSVDPVYVDFYVPQQKLSNIEVGFQVQVSMDDLHFIPIDGIITAIASEVDTSTRNVLVRATLSNEAGKMRPGMFVEAKILQPVAREVLVIPSTAVLYAPYGNSLFVAEKSESGNGLVATQRFVRLGEMKGDYVEILKGVKEGEAVVTSGAFKLRSGAAIVTDNAKDLKYSTTPTPEDA